MAVTITHTQVRSITAEALFRVSDTVNASTNIASSVFVFRFDDQAFSHVATASDVQTYPDTYAAAQLSGAGYYRQATVERDFLALEAASAFSTMLNSRLQSLCVEYNTLLAGFVGSTNSTVTS